MKFDKYSISFQLKENIAKLGYKKPTDIQFKAIPNILKGEDLLAIAQTGTGKTAAFAIPILHKIHDSKIKGRKAGVKCLIMAPTHELALQIHSVFEKLGKGLRAKSFCIHGGVEQDPQKEQLDKGVDILVATPGRMFDLVSQGSLRLDAVEVLILDEADHMLDLGFIGDIRDLMRHVPKKRQTLFFSATIDDNIKKVAYSLVRNAIRIQLSPNDPVAKNISHAVASVEMDDKRFFLENLINNQEDKKILVFVRTKVRAERVKKAMERVGITTDTIHGDRTQDERNEVMKAYRTGKLKILVATDVSARGIDIPDVEYVVNYDLPDSPETYVHRVGRTGRGRDKGQAVSFYAPEENDLLKEIEDSLGKPIARLELSKNEYKEIVDTTGTPDEHDWKSLMHDQAPKKKKKKKKKK